MNLRNYVFFFSSPLLPVDEGDLMLYFVWLWMCWGKRNKKKIDFDDINKKKGVMNILINQRHRVSITLITSFYFILTRLHHRNIEYQLIIKLLLSSRWKEMLRLFKKKKFTHCLCYHAKMCFFLIASNDFWSVISA